jgi:hypothetical protein
MRRITLPTAALLVLLSASPALASAGLPKIASLQLGPHQAAIHNDSQSARIGSNTITVEVTDVPAGHSVHLHFVGPNGEVLEPTLRPLQVLTGPADAHGGHESSTSEHASATADHTQTSTGHGHEMSGHTASGHDAAPAPAPAAPADQHADQHATGHDTAGQGATFTTRTNVTFPEGGTWKAILAIGADHGDTLQAEAPFEVTYGGPNRVFVASSGLIIIGSILYGALNKRRQSGGR